MERNNQVQFRVSQLEKEAIEREADRQRMPAATWMRSTLLALADKGDKEAAELARQLEAASR